MAAINQKRRKNRRKISSGGSDGWHNVWEIDSGRSECYGKKRKSKCSWRTWRSRRRKMREGFYTWPAWYKTQSLLDYLTDFSLFVYLFAYVRTCVHGLLFVLLCVNLSFCLSACIFTARQTDRHSGRPTMPVESQTRRSNFQTQGLKAC